MGRLILSPHSAACADPVPNRAWEGKVFGGLEATSSSATLCHHWSNTTCTRTIPFHSLQKLLHFLFYWETRAFGHTHPPKSTILKTKFQKGPKIKKWAMLQTLQKCPQDHHRGGKASVFVRRTMIAAFSWIEGWQERGFCWEGKYFRDRRLHCEEEGRLTGC